MKHATPATLKQLEPLLVLIRGFGGLIKRKLGKFYRRSSAFLHFHENDAFLFADVKLDGIKFVPMCIASQSGACPWAPVISNVRHHSLI